MYKPQSVTGIQSETKPLLDYSSLYYASHRSASTSDHQKQQQQQLQQLQQLPSDKRLTKSKRGLLLVVAGVATALLLVAAIVVLAVAISKSVQHNSSSDNGNTPANIASMNTTLQTLQLGASRAQVQSGNSRQILGASRRKPVQTDTDDRDGRKAEADDTQSFADDDSYRTADTGAGQRSDKEELDEVDQFDESAQEILDRENKQGQVIYALDDKQEAAYNETGIQESDDKVLVRTNFGKIAGIKMKSRQGRSFYAFLKIPYAKPPVGKRRFRNPELVRSWRGVLDATISPPLCIQKVKYSPIVEATGEEDCLYMSIFDHASWATAGNKIILQSGKDTPKLTFKGLERRKLLPVMFYIHGGGFTDGRGIRYGANYFMDEDVVLITFQYRLGSLGFMTTNDDDIPGNLGLKDQVMALEFLRKIVKYFGGDKDRITIFGNSAGGISVASHLLSPLSKGLFSRAIAQSGNALHTLGESIDLNPAITVKIVAERFNCSYDSRKSTFKKQKLSDCLRKVNAADLAVVRSEETSYAPTVEPPTRDAFLPDLPLNLMRNGKMNRAEVIFDSNRNQFLTVSGDSTDCKACLFCFVTRKGVNSGEGIFDASNYWTPSLIDSMNSDWASVAPKLFRLNSSAFDTEALSYRVREFYFQHENVSNDTLKNLVALCGDRTVIHATKVQATYQAAVSPVYLYYMSKRSLKSYGAKDLAKWPPANYGAAHADELQFLFPYDGFPEINTTSEYFKFSADLVKTWAKFAADGKPDENWKQFMPKKQEQWYKLDDNRAMTDDPVERMKLWDSYSPHDLQFE